MNVHVNVGAIGTQIAFFDGVAITLSRWDGIKKIKIC